MHICILKPWINTGEHHLMDSDLWFSKMVTSQRTLLSKNVSYLLVYHGGILETAALNTQCHTGHLSTPL